MSRINTLILSQLANLPAMAMASNFGVASPDLAEAMKQLDAERKMAMNKAAASEILTLCGDSDSFIKLNSENIVRMEKEIAKTKVLMAAVQRAQQFGLATQNFIPLLSILGKLDISVPDGVAKEVPKDWTAPVAAAAQASTSQAS